MLQGRVQESDESSHSGEHLAGCRRASLIKRDLQHTWAYPIGIPLWQTYNVTRYHRSPVFVHLYEFHL